MRENDQALVVLTTGKRDRGSRASLTFARACAALTMNGTVWALRGAVDEVLVQGFKPLAEYLDQFRALGRRNARLRALFRVLLQFRSGQAE